MKTLATVFLITCCIFVQEASAKTDDSPSQLSGVINGIDVVLDEAVFADKALQIKTKAKDGFKARLGFHLPIENGVVPELKKFSSSDNGKVPLSKPVNITYYWKDPAGGKTVFAFMKRGEYEVDVEFGRETEKGIPGRLLVKNTELGVEVEGDFVAEIRGLRLVDGHPDLQCDHRDTIIYAGELYLRKKLNLPSLKISSVKDLRYLLKAGDKKAGWLDGEYKDADGRMVFVRLQFIKNDKGWEVFRQLRADQLAGAHPIVSLDVTKVEDVGGTVDTKILNFLTVRALEADLQKEFPGKGFSENIGSGYSFNPRTGIGYNKASYTFSGESKRFFKTYLLRKIDGFWRVERALKEGEKVNTRTGKVEMFASVDGKTLCEIAAKGDAKLAGVLLKNNADVNAKDTKGVTPLIYAAAGGHEQIVKLLIDRGADVNAMANDGRRALYVSVARGDMEIVKLLIDANAEVNNIKDGHGGTVFHTAAVWDRDEIAGKLIEAGGDVRLIDGAGNTTLDLAQWWGSEKTAKVLKGAGARIIKASGQQGQLAGCVRGMQMVPAEVQIDMGKFLYFYGNKGRMDPPKVTVFLKTERGVLPIKRSFKVDHGNAESTGFVSNVSYEFSTKSRGNRSIEWLHRKDYELNLTFGDEKNGMLEGEILLESPGKDIRLKGSFKAKITGLRMIDGHPDLQSDSMETLRYAAKLYLQDKPGKDDIEVSDAGGNYSGWYRSNEKVGWVDVNYKVGDDSEKFSRVQLRKGKDGWKVARELKGNELRPAHPLVEVDKKDSDKYFLYLACQRLEKDLQQEYPNSNYRTEMHASRRFSDRHGIGQVELNYYILGADKRHSRKYLLRRVEDDWTVDRILSEDEKINTRTGKIEKTE